jgi:hypothetical protein
MRESMLVRAQIAFVLSLVLSGLARAVDFDCIALPPDPTTRPSDCDTNPDPSGWCDCLKSGLTDVQGGGTTTLEQAIVDVYHEPTVGTFHITVDGGTLDLKNVTTGDIIGGLLIDQFIGQAENFYVKLDFLATDTGTESVEFNVTATDTNETTKAVLGYDPLDQAHAGGLTYRGMVQSKGEGGGFDLSFAYIDDFTTLPGGATSTGLESGDLTRPGFSVQVMLQFPLVDIYTLPAQGPLGVTSVVDQIFADPAAPVERTFTESIEIKPAVVGPTFRRGDTNGDGAVDLSDAIATLGFLFLGEGTATCLDALDVNDDGQVDLSDPIGVLGFLFQGAAAPPAPGPDACGPDPTDDTLAVCVPKGC